jgi:hypothetical protein
MELFCDWAAYYGVSFSKRDMVFQQKGKFGTGKFNSSTILGIYEE